MSATNLQLHHHPTMQNTDSEIPRQIRSEVSDTIEEIGNALGLLREAINDTESGNIDGGKTVASDALEIISGLELRYSQIAAKLSTWSKS